MKHPIVACSGGMDPLHDGHVAYIEDASRFGNVHIYLNTDEWLMKKKGYVFMPFAQRARILWAIKGVTLVIPADDEDGSVWKSLQKFKPDFFAKGGDRTPDNMPIQELELCADLGIEILYGVGGDKIESSSELVKRARDHQKHTPVIGDWAK